MGVTLPLSKTFGVLVTQNPVAELRPYEACFVDDADECTDVSSTQ